METLSEDLLDVLSVICHWSTYHGTHCRRTIEHDGKTRTSSLCSLHKELMVDYEYLIEEEELCETSHEVKIVPRSHKHLKSVMTQLQNEDDIVEVCTKETVGGLTEEADISNEDYIKLLSDDSKYYYEPQNRGDRKTKDLKVVLRRYCPDHAVIHARGGNYCEECYRKLKNVPKLSVVKARTKSS